MFERIHGSGGRAQVLSFADEKKKIVCWSRPMSMYVERFVCMFISIRMKSTERSRGSSSAQAQCDSRRKFLYCHIPHSY